MAHKCRYDSFHAAGLGHQKSVLGYWSKYGGASFSSYKQTNSRAVHSASADRGLELYSEGMANLRGC
jgi:hypothetical protein